MFLFCSLSIFFLQKDILILIFICYSGKTTLLNVMAMGHPVETCPTIGLNVKLVKKAKALIYIEL